ncbi:MAG: hypothetical protein ACTSRX_01435 [Promethearchaeota archaeon]
MTIDFEGILNDLFSKGIVIAAVVCRYNGEIVHTSSNWSVEQSDLSQCIKKWQSRGQFTHLQDRKYALLMNTPEYFSGVNFKDKDFLLGAASLDEDDRYYVIGYAPAGVSGRNAYVDVVRAATQLKEGSTYMDNSSKMGKYDDSQVAGDAGAAAGGMVDNSLKQEIDGFISWIKDTNGLSGYIQYYLDQNDPVVLAKIAKAYNDFRRIFGF